MTHQPKSKPWQIYLDGGANLDFVLPQDQPKFPKAAINAIARSHNIRGAKEIRAFESKMRYAAGVYFQYLEYIKSRPERKDIINHFKSLKNAANELTKKIKTTRENRHKNYVWNRIAASLQDELTYSAHPLPHSKTSRLEEINFARVTKINERESSIFCLDLNDVKASLAYIALISETATDLIAKDKKGNPGDRALGRWVWSMVDFWERELGRKFTLDTHTKIAISPFGRFCQDCLSLVDPAAIPKLAGALANGSRLNMGRKKLLDQTALQTYGKKGSLAGSIKANIKT